MSKNKTELQAYFEGRIGKAIPRLCLSKCCRDYEMEREYCKTPRCPLFMYRTTELAADSTLSELKRAIKRYCHTTPFCDSNPAQCEISCPLAPYSRV